MQPAHGLSHSFTFSLTKKRLQMMTKPNSPLRSTLKTLLTLPLFFALGFLFGCESIPADSANNQMDIHIEFTDSDHILFNGEEVQVADLEPKLKLLSEDYELHFILKDHPDMLAGPVMNVNRLVEKYRSSDDNKPDTSISIYITDQSQLMVEGESYSLEELGTVLRDKMIESNIMVNLRVNQNAEFGQITDVQQLLRQIGALRINYSVLRDDYVVNAEEYDSEVNVDALNIAARKYMSVSPSEHNLDELEKEFQKFMEIHEAFHQSQLEIYSDSSFTPPPPPAVPSPMSRMNDTEVTHTLILPPLKSPSPQDRIEKEIENAVLVSPPPPPPPIAERNVLRVLINNQGMILVNKQPANLDDIRDFVTNFINNNGADPDLSESPTEAIIAIKTERRTPYDLYIEILDEVMGAYQDLRNQASLDHFGQSFESLDSESDEIQEIRNLYPKRISIAEPKK
jgi:biopolymer transport protein ExbD